MPNLNILSLLMSAARNGSGIPGANVGAMMGNQIQNANNGVGPLPGLRNSTPDSAMQDFAQNSPSATEAFVGPGRRAELDSKRSVNDIYDRLAASQQQQKEQDKQLAWMKFFSTMAKSTNPNVFTTLGDAADAMTNTKISQTSPQRKNEEELAASNAKYQEFLDQQDIAKQNADSAVARADALGTRADAYADREKTGSPQALGKQISTAERIIKNPDLYQPEEVAWAHDVFTKLRDQGKVSPTTGQSTSTDIPIFSSPNDPAFSSLKKGAQFYITGPDGQQQKRTKK